MFSIALVRTKSQGDLQSIYKGETTTGSISKTKSSHNLVGLARLHRAQSVTELDDEDEEDHMRRSIKRQQSTIILDNETKALLSYEKAIEDQTPATEILMDTITDEKGNPKSQIVAGTIDKLITVMADMILQGIVKPRYQT